MYFVSSFVNFSRFKLINIINFFVLVVLFYYISSSFVFLASSIGKELGLHVPRFLDKLFYDCLVVLAVSKSFIMIKEKNYYLFVISLFLLLLFYKIYSVNHGNRFIFEQALLAVSCYSLNYKKILSAFVISVAFIICLEVCLSLLSVIPDYLYYRGSFVRHSFGHVYPTNFAAAVFFLIITFWCIFTKNNNLLFIIIISIFYLVQYKFLGTRNTQFLSIVFLLFIGYYEIIYRSKNKNIYLLKLVKYSNYILIVIFPLFALLSIFLLFSYNSSSQFLSNLNELFSGRFELANVAYKKYGISLWGKDIFFKGLGGGEDIVGNYLFIDSSYCLLLIKYGFVSLVLFCMSFVFTQLRALRHKQYKILLVFSLIAMHSFTEHHYFEFFYNPFILILFADLSNDNVDIREQ